MNILFTAITFPFIGAIAAALFPRRIKAMMSVFVLGFSFLLNLLIVPQVLKTQQIIFIRNLTDWFSISFIADGLSVCMGIISSFVAFLISLYSIEYMSHYEDTSEFYFWMVLFVASMTGLVFSANLILLFCFWEMTSVCSWRLIGFYRKDKDNKAADKAFLVTFFGASLLLIGIIIIYITYGTLEITELRGIMVPNLIAFLILGGIIAKSAQLPLQSWLPDAGVAPTPVTALLHAAVLVKIGIYLFARIFGLVFIESPLFLSSVISISVLTIIVGAASALVENNIKRILAYSTISQLGYILLALALNSNISFKVAILYILAHSLAKAGLFLCIGIVEQKSNTKDINQLGGLIKTMPLTATAYLLCAFSVIGIPPFLGFWPKFMTIMLCARSGYIIATIVAVIGAVFTLLYLMRLFNKVFLGEEKICIKEQEKAKSLMTIVVVCLGVISLALGLWFSPVFNFIESIFK